MRPDVDVDQVALEVIAMIMGLEYQWVTDPARVDFGQAMETYIDQLIVQLAPAPAARRCCIARPQQDGCR